MSTNMSVTQLLMKGKGFKKFTFFYCILLLESTMSSLEEGQSVSSILMRFFQSES